MVKKRRSNVKGKFRDIIGLMNTTLEGKVVEQEDGTFEIKIENLVYSTYMSLFIKRDDEDIIKKTSLIVKQGLLKNKIQRHFVSYIDLEKVFVSITPSSDVAFLFTTQDRYTVINIFKNGTVEIVNAIDRRKDEDDKDDSNNEKDRKQDGEKKSYSEKRNNFSSKGNNKEQYYKDLEEKKRKERQKRKIFITL